MKVSTSATSEKSYDYRRGAIGVLDGARGLMRCSHCGAEWLSNLKHGGGYHRGSWTCYHCGANTKSRWSPASLEGAERCGDDSGRAALSGTVAIDATAAAEYDAVANHEAGHAIMRWLHGLPATTVEIFPAGRGRVEGTGRRIPHRCYLLMSLAGYAAELGYVIVQDRTGSLKICAPRLVWDRDKQSPGSDLYRASSLLDSDWRLREKVNRKGECVPRDTEDVIQEYFALASDIIYEHLELLEILSNRLQADGILQPRTLAALCREYGKRWRRECVERPKMGSLPRESNACRRDGADSSGPRRRSRSTGVCRRPLTRSARQ
jgi:hypothetical protein